MVWSNYYLIPILVVGGLFAFMFGQTVIGRVLAVVSAPFRRKPATDDVMSNNEPIHHYYHPEPAPDYSPKCDVPPRKPTHAERQAEWDARALALADEREAEANRLRALDLEESRIAALREENRKNSKSTNALIGKLQVDPTAGPLTTAMAMTDAVQEMLKAAAAKRDSARPNG